MSVILLVSIAIRLLAFLWSLRLLRRLGDWRIGFLSAMVALMALRQILTVAKDPIVWDLSTTARPEEFPGLIVSVLAFLALIFMEHMIRDERERNRQLAAAVQCSDEERLAAIKANKAKDAFLANASHHLRTPLNAIIGFSEIMRKQDGASTSESFQHYAALIHDSGTELLQTVNGLLDITAVESGAFEGQIETVHVPDLLSGILTNFEDVAARKSLTLERDWALSPEVVECDGHVIRQIVTHLVSNAVNYTATGGTVRLAAAFPRDGILAITVSDTGVGMSDAFIRRIGEPFLRAHEDSYVADQSGTGLGLAIVRGLVRRIGATWDIDSAPDKGTTITIEIPVQAAGYGIPDFDFQGHNI